LLLVVMLDSPCSDEGGKPSGYPLHSPLSPSLPLPCVTVCHQILRALYHDNISLQIITPPKIYFLWNSHNTNTQWTRQLVEGLSHNAI